MKTRLLEACNPPADLEVDESALRGGVEQDHLGPVSLIHGRHVAVFPNLHEARRAADAALHPDVGGFETVSLCRAPANATVTHASLEDWLLN